MFKAVRGNETLAAFFKTCHLMSPLNCCTYRKVEKDVIPMVY